jgi:hypothetical protein
LIIKLIELIEPHRCHKIMKNVDFELIFGPSKNTSKMVDFEPC